MLAKGALLHALPLPSCQLPRLTPLCRRFGGFARTAFGRSSSSTKTVPEQRWQLVVAPGVRYGATFE